MYPPPQQQQQQQQHHRTIIEERRLPSFEGQSQFRTVKRVKAGRFLRAAAILSIVAAVQYLYFLTQISHATTIAQSSSNNNNNSKNHKHDKRILNNNTPMKKSLEAFTEKSKPVVTTPVIQKKDESSPISKHQQLLPSAKTLLTMDPPFPQKEVKMSPNLVESPNTIVTGYFRVRGKHHSTKYDEWMTNFLSLQDPMVVFTEPELVEQIQKLRQHALNRTVVVPIALDDLPIAKVFPEAFWKDQLERDPEKKIHRSYQLFWIWLSKSWCVQQAINMNPFRSDLFVWSDIGCFRDTRYNTRTLVQHREHVPAHEMLQMAHRDPNPPKENLFNDKYKQKEHFYHSGSLFVGYKDTWKIFHERFLETIDRFLDRDMIIVEDQAILQSTCLSHPELCAYAKPKNVADNKYFGIRFVLHQPGDFSEDYWRYTPNHSTNQKQ